MKKKSFDCVEMKSAIHKQMLDQAAGKPEDVARRLRNETVAASPRLSRFLLRIRPRDGGASTACPRD